ncbi:MAG: hypothetical protein AAF518_22060 [Spirochaetota bacterium]
MRFFVWTLLAVFSIEIAEFTPLQAQAKQPYFRKGIEAIFQRSYPKSAPDTYEKAIQIPVPDPYEAFRIEFLHTEQIQGKKEYVRIDSPNFYHTSSYWRWKKGNAQIIWYEKSHIILKFAKHRIIQWFLPGKAGEFKMEWTFPDNSQLLIYKYPDTRKNKYVYYNREGKILQYYRLVPHKTLFSEVETWGNLEFHYNPVYKYYVEQWKRSGIYPQLVDYLYKKTGARNQGKIPILLFDDERAYQEYSDSSVKPHTVQGLREEVVLCCNDYRLADFSDPMAEDPPDEITFQKLVHGLTENILDQGCFANGANPDDFTIRETAGFLSAGLSASFWASRNQLYKFFLQKRFLDSLSTKAPYKNWTKSTDQDDFAMDSMMLLYYMQNQDIKPGILPLYQKSCTRSFLRAEAPGLAKIYRAAAKHYHEAKDSYRHAYEKYKFSSFAYYYRYKDNLPGFALVSQSLQPGNVVTDIKEIPYFFHAYKTATPYYRKIVKDSLPNYRFNKQKDWLKSKDAFTVQDGKFTIHHDFSEKDGSLFKVSLDFDGHSIINERDGILKWIFPDGSKAIVHRKTPKELIYRNRIDEVLLDGNSNLYEHFTLTGKENIIADKTVYSKDEPIVIRYSGLHSNHKSILLVVAKNEPDSILRNAQKIAYRKEGSLSFPAMPVGEYEARLYLHWPYGGMRVYKRIPITVEKVVPKKEEKQ